jgi:ABC-type sugar transport system ATPase subunit
LDAGLRLALREEIKTLQQKLRTTTLYVTHDQSEAMALGDRLCVLRDGRIQQVGPPTEVYDRPANRFVAGFFGTPPMNFLTGEIHFENGACFLDWAGGRVSVSLLPADSKEKVVHVGIRPHDFSLEPLPTPNGCVLSGRVSLPEPFGSRTDVHVVLASGQKCIVSMPPDIQLKTGDEAQVWVDGAKLHLFRSDGVALNRSGGSRKAEGPGL